MHNSYGIIHFLYNVHWIRIECSSFFSAKCTIATQYVPFLLIPLCAIEFYGFFSTKVHQYLAWEPFRASGASLHYHTDICYMFSLIDCWKDVYEYIISAFPGENSKEGEVNPDKLLPITLQWQQGRKKALWCLDSAFLCSSKGFLISKDKKSGK